MAAVVMSAVVAVGAQAVVAGANVATTLPWSAFGPSPDLAVDAGNGRVFVSSGGTSNLLAVTNLSGALLGTVALAGPSAGLTLHAGTLYVAEPSAYAIAAYNPSTLVLEHTYSTAPYSTPEYLTVVGPRIWFGTGTCPTTPGTIASLNLQTGKVLADGEPGLVCPRLLASPKLPGVLFAYNSGSSGGGPSDSMWKFSVTSVIPKLLAESTTPTMSIGAQAVITSDGSSLWVTGNYPYQVVQLRTSDLQPTGQVINDGFVPDALTTVPGSPNLAMTMQAQPGVPNVQVFAPGASTRSFGYNAQDPDLSQVAPFGLTATPDGKHLLVLTVSSEGTELNVIKIAGATGPAILSSVLPVSGPAEGGQTVTLSGLGLLGTTKVLLGGASQVASYSVRSDTELQFKTGAVGQGEDDQVYVLGPGGWADEGPTYTYNMPTPSSVPTPGAGSTAWPTDHYSNTRVADYPSEQIITPANASQIVRYWALPIGTTVTSPPIVVNGVVYLSSLNSQLWAINARTGAVIWQFNGSGTYSSTPAFDNGGVAWVDGNCNLYYVNAQTGSVIWDVKPGGPSCGEPMVINGRVSVTVGTSLVAYDEQTGALDWQSAPALVNSEASDGNVIVAASTNNIYAFDSSTGAILWSQSPGANTDFGAPAIANGRVYIPVGQELYALDLQTGAIDWWHGLPNLWTVIGPPLATPTTVYLLGRRYDAATGVDLGAGPAPQQFDTGLVAGDLFVTNLRITQLSTNQLVYSSPDCCWSQSSAPAVVNGVIYIVVQGRLLAYGLPS